MPKFFNGYFDVDDESHWLLIKHLIIFMYDEDDGILENGLHGLEQIMRRSMNAEKTDRIISNEYVAELGQMYTEKRQRNELLFSGYISMYIKLISNDFAFTIFNYYNFYNL